MACTHAWPVRMHGLCACMACAHACPMHMHVLYALHMVLMRVYVIACC
jgi:hypothetical protein